MRLFLFIILLFYTLSVFTQDYYSDIKKVSDVFKSSDFKTNMEILTFNQYGKVTNKTDAFLLQIGTRYYSKYNNVEIIQDRSTTLIIDHLSKVVTYFNFDAKKARETFSIEKDLEKLKKSIDSVNFLGDFNGVRSYELFSSPDALILNSKVFINLNNFTLKKIEYIYNTEIEGFDMDMVSAVILYKSFDLNIEDKNEFPKVSSIVKIKNSNYELSSNYSTYQLEISK